MNNEKSLLIENESSLEVCKDKVKKINLMLQDNMTLLDTKSIDKNNMSWVCAHLEDIQARESICFDMIQGIMSELATLTTNNNMLCNKAE